MARRFLPLLDRVLVKRFQVTQNTQKTVGGIILPESATKKENPLGEVVQIGTSTDEITVKVGQTVVLPDYKGQTVMFEGQEYDLYRAEELLGVVEEQV
mmetsp:Transcript_5347/g.19975  ORF Transcript_5347/g.19975 Transcript_5347/m.19975 type:complete len:98 (-) Transcript_5347:232-525(-)|eukprot:CAMPEP_0117448772 /NCGR_PEP_ID=MMETSP0759-20121206/7581_1 /TAXON_ID=63605 /ORGANISM="Percolomonas cosmopolitus, Strain WS" /LENGTH=97 /DNA_ID=CAMNT_0005241185 /DNA_START=43 /DNA_END=336 /DNA_ORIENTATION=-